MTVQFGLNIVTLVMCIITLTMATAALMPQIKMGLVVLRDGVLWALLLGVVGFVGVVGWTRLHEKRLNSSVPATSATDSPLIDQFSPIRFTPEPFSPEPFSPEPFSRERTQRTASDSRSATIREPIYQPTYESESRYESRMENSSVDRYLESLDVSLSPVREDESPRGIRPNRSGPRRSRLTGSQLQPVFYDSYYRGN